MKTMRNSPFMARIRQIEFNLPETVESNEDLLVQNPDWDMAEVFEKTGVARRYLAAPEQTAADLCVEAAEKLFQRGQISKDEIDALLFCTQSPDYALPTTACIIQDRLKLPTRTAAFDFNLGCSGFVYGLAIAGAMVDSCLSQNVLLLCGETYTKYIDAHDRTCRPIFSDAGSATLIQRSEQPRLGPFVLGTDGSGHCNLIVPNSGTRAAGQGSVNGGKCLKMDGPRVFMFTRSAVPGAVKSLLAKAEMTVEDVDLFVFHQASKLVLDDLTKNLKLPVEKVVQDLETIGNTVSATIPIALKRAVDAGRLAKGLRVMLVGFGVGYSWGACLVQWE